MVPLEMWQIMAPWWRSEAVLCKCVEILSAGRLFIDLRLAGEIIPLL